MSLTPDWAPNIHPIVVHFPIALLTAALVVDLFSLFIRKHPTARNTATWLYCAGTATAILAYFSGRNGANAMLLPAQMNLLVNEHADWAFRTTWFFAFFASVRLAVSYILPPKPLVLGGAFIIALAGVTMLFETAEHGAILVYQHGLGVQAITTDESLEDIVTETYLGEIDPGITHLENGSWLWRPALGADVVLSDQFTSLENDVVHLAPDMVNDQENGPVLGLHPHGMPVLFVGGEPIAATQADVRVNVDSFDGTLLLVYHVQNEKTFDFLAVRNNVLSLGRTEDGEQTVFDEKPFEDHGWLALRVFGGDGHFRGYVNGELLTHGHTDDLAPGPFGLRVDGTGTVLVERFHVQAIY